MATRPGSSEDLFHVLHTAVYEYNRQLATGNWHVNVSHVRDKPEMVSGLVVAIGFLFNIDV